MKLIKLAFQLLSVFGVSLAYYTDFFQATTMIALLCFVPSVVFGIGYLIRFAPGMSFTGVSQEN